MSKCRDCGGPLEQDFEDRVICDRCCQLALKDQCHDHLQLGEGMVECWIARKDHYPAKPHHWNGIIGGRDVRIEWR